MRSNPRHKIIKSQKIRWPWHRWPILAAALRGQLRRFSAMSHGALELHRCLFQVPGSYLKDTLTDGSFEEYVYIYIYILNYMYIYRY